MKKFMLFLAAAMTMLLSGCSRESSSVGVIGGADGPTAVFTTGLNFPIFIPVIAVAVVIVLVAVYFITKHNR